MLAAYPLGDPAAEFIRHNENMTYRITDRANGKSYLLRIHKPITENLKGVQHTLDGLRSELQLLEDMAAQTALIAQTPVRTLSAQTVAVWETADEAVPYTLLSWIDGKTMEREDMEETASIRQLGRELALLHGFLRRYAESPPPSRPVYDLHRNLESLERIRHGAETGIIGGADMETIEKSFALINRRIGDLEVGPDLWGFIHADLNMGNVIVTDRGYSFIDFCLSGFGYFMLDVAQCALNVRKDRRDAFLDAYAQSFPLPAQPLDYLAGFMLAAIFGNYAFQMKNPAKRERIKERLPIVCETYGKPFLEGGESIFYRI